MDECREEAIFTRNLVVRLESVEIFPGTIDRRIVEKPNICIREGYTGCGQGVKRQKLLNNRIYRCRSKFGHAVDSAGWKVVNVSVREVGNGPIVNRTGNRLIAGWYPLDITDALIVPKDKQLVPDDRPSTGPSELVLLKRGFGSAVGIVEEVGCIQLIV